MKETNSADEQEFAKLTVAFDRHPDAAEVQRSFQHLVDKSTLSGTIIDAEIVPTKGDLRPMAESRRRLVGIYLTVVSAVLLIAMLWVWPQAAAVMAAPAPGTAEVTLLGIGFTMSTDLALVLIVSLAAMLGSMVVLTKTFSYRAGHETLERGYLWWYVARPFTGAMLGLLFYLAVVAGFFNAATTQGRPALVIAAAIGGLAGLFTDQVMTKMRSALGLLPTNEPASNKDDAEK